MRVIRKEHYIICFINLSLSLVRRHFLKVANIPNSRIEDDAAIKNGVIGSHGVLSFGGITIQGTDIGVSP